MHKYTLGMKIYLVYKQLLTAEDDTNWFASVCIKHGGFQSRRSKGVTVAMHRLSTTTKETVFRS